MPDILIVEDGLHERERLEKLFTTGGFSVRTAESASIAEDLLSVNKFRLCVLDIGLSDKSGSLLFQTIRRQDPKPLVVILTGNPSIYLKQKFLDEGAVSFILKASPESENENLLASIKSFLGSPETVRHSGIELSEFLKSYVQDSSRELFLNDDLKIVACRSCSKNNFEVIFTHKTQLPPLVEGKVVCADCGEIYDPEVG